MTPETEVAIQSNFNLKNEAVNLIGGSVEGRVSLSLTELEAIRTGGRAVPASKHGLETICGASCETGAQ